MRVYYDENTGAAQFTYNGAPELAPSGTFIEVPDAILTSLHGLSVINGQLVRTSLAEPKQQATTEINSVVGRARLNFITDQPGQDLIYAQKREEALAYLAENPEPVDLSNYVLMAGEVGPGLTAATPYELAQIWLNMGVFWKVVASTLEGIRMGFSNAVSSATSTQEIDAIISNFYMAINAALAQFSANNP